MNNMSEKEIKIAAEEAYEDKVHADVEKMLANKKYSVSEIGEVVISK